VLFERACQVCSFVLRDICVWLPHKPHAGALANVAIAVMYCSALLLVLHLHRRVTRCSFTARWRSGTMCAACPPSWMLSLGRSQIGMPAAVNISLSAWSTSTVILVVTYGSGILLACHTGFMVDLCRLVHLAGSSRWLPGRPCASACLASHDQ
jgi:hypothetical protein